MTKITKEAKKPQRFKIEFRFNDEVLKSTGYTIADALDKLKVGQIKTKGVLKVKSDKGEKEMVFPQWRAKKLFQEELFRDMISKILED